MKKQRFTTLGLALLVGFGINGLAQEPDQLTDADLASARVKTVRVAPQAHLNGQAHARFGIPNIDSLVNFNDHFFSDGFDNNGNPNRQWYTNGRNAIYQQRSGIFCKSKRIFSFLNFA